MTPKLTFYKSGILTLYVISSTHLTGCAVTNGFDPARSAINDFSTGAQAGKTYIDTRNAKILDQSKLDLLQWHTVYVNGNQNVPKIAKLNKERLFQPGDNNSDNKTALETIAKTVICKQVLTTEEGAFLLQSAQNSANSFKVFDFKESEKSLTALKNLLRTPKPKIVTVEEIESSGTAKLAADAEESKCHDDFKAARENPFMSKEPLSEAGGAESGLLGIAGIETVSGAYDAVKALDAKLAGMLNTVLSYKRRNEFNKYVKQQETELKALSSALKEYAKHLDQSGQKSVRLTAMTNYLFAFDEFSASMTNRKRNETNSLFIGRPENLAENKKAIALLEAANAYTSARNTDPASAIKKLARSIDSIVALTNKPTTKDIRTQYNAAEDFIDSLSELAKATKDEDLKKALSDLKGLF